LLGTLARLTLALILGRVEHRTADLVTEERERRTL